eukprot:gnl/Trimastix_PCT/3709.p1 GENE.gnl/Trimastix_PCT/3709~~gnl/Trimastix_PCT/3709.p1  ORF type:complete len:197 (+),score=71.45 gnl/Trimastix_PCT/3709:35-592(+)
MEKHGTSESVNDLRENLQGPILSPEEIASFKEVFELIDKEKRGYLNNKELILVIRAVGHNPTEAELDTLIQELRTQDPTNPTEAQLDTTQEVPTPDPTRVSLPEFILLMSRLVKESESTEEDIKEAFKVFDDGSSMIHAQELRHVMTNLGEKFSDEEIQELLNELSIGLEDSINFEDFVKMMICR